MKGEGLGFFERGESVKAKEGKAGFLVVERLLEGAEVGWGEGVEALLLLVGGLEAVLIDAYVVPASFGAVE